MFKLIKKYMKIYKKEFILAPFFKMIEAIFDLLVPIIVAIIIDKGIKENNITLIYQMIGVLIVFCILGLAFSLIAQYYASCTAQKVGSELRRHVFSKVTSLSMNEMQNENQIITNMTNDIYQIQTGIALTLRFALRYPILIIGASISALIINYKFGLIFLALTPLLFILIFAISKATSPRYLNNQKQLEEISSKTNDTIAGQRIIKSFYVRKLFINKFNKANHDLTNNLISVNRISALLNPASSLLLNTAIIVVVLLGAHGVNKGIILTGEIAAYINYLSQILFAIIMLANFIIIFTKAQSSATRINELFNTKSSITFPNNDSDMIDLNSNISLIYKNVGFKFKKDSNYAIQHINFTLKKRETLGIVGGTGSGKSSIVNLLFKIYKPTEGKINLYKEDLQNLSKKQISKLLSIVPQRPTLFNKTIRENLLIGNNSSVTDEDLIDALRYACAYDFTKTKKGFLDYPVNENGKNFSGGQKQRLAIARALASKSKILVLDDSFSALDNKTAKKIKTNLQKLKYDNIIIIAEKINAVKDLDRILVINNGQQIDIGTHKELFNRCDVYKEFCLSQNINEDEK